MSAEQIDLARRRISECRDVHSALLGGVVPETVVAAAARILECCRAQGAVLVLGNGGSAALASHIAAELVGRYLLERRPLAAIALVDNGSAVTAIGNDYGFENVFARQVAALARPGDVVIGLTTSGRSANVVEGLRTARGLGCTTIAFTGGEPADAGRVADLCLCVPTASTPRVQEGHELIAHILCELVEAEVAAE